LVVALIASAVGAGAQAAAAAPPRPRSGETLAAQLLRPAALRAAPGGRMLARLSARTTFGLPTVLAVVGRRGRWLRVLSDARPNGASAWIPAAGTRLLRETWSIEVRLSRRLLVVRHRGRPYARMTVGIGRPSSPTPTGRFAVVSRLRPSSPALGYGEGILGLTGRQAHLPRSWTGGDRLAIHGTDDPATIGAPASLGCLHVAAADLRLLMERIPLGTQVRIRA
jgi:hypothetical protein